MPNDPQWPGGRRFPLSLPAVVDNDVARIPGPNTASLTKPYRISELIATIGRSVSARSPRAGLSPSVNTLNPAG